MKPRTPKASDSGISLEGKSGLSELFAEALAHLPTREDTKAYVVGVCIQITPDSDLSQRSLTLAYAEAIQAAAFERWSTLADWILWAGAWAPQSLRERELALVLGRKAYETCYRYMPGWELFLELSSELPRIIEAANLALKPKR